MLRSLKQRTTLQSRARALVMLASVRSTGQPDAELTVMGRRLLSQQVRNEWVLLTFMDVNKNGKDSSVSPGVTW